MLVCGAGQQARVRHISIQGLVPQTDNYVTYDGSLTQPGCQETVTWIIVNKPLYISVDNVRTTDIIYLRPPNTSSVNSFMIPNPKLLQLVWDKGQPLRSLNTMGPMDLWDPVGRTDSLGGPALGKMSKTC